MKQNTTASYLNILFKRFLVKKAVLGLLVILLITSVESLKAQVSGTIFRDFNGNGTQQTVAPTIEPGISGITVNAYNTNDVLLATATTAANGTYTLLVGSNAVRVEYVLPTNCTVSPLFDFPGLQGATFGSNVQFKTGGAGVTANFALNNPADYVNTVNPNFLINTYRNGNPMIEGTASVQPAMYQAAYSNAGTTPLPTQTALSSQIGSTWGIAYSKQYKKAFTSAYLKRHVGMGPGGPTGAPSAVNAPGSIYFINPSSTTGGSFFFSLDALGPAFYTHNHTAGAALNVRDNVTRGISGNIATANADATTYDQIGKVGIGDLEISDDGRYLFLVNFYDRKLYKIDLQNATSPVTPTAAQITTYAIPNPNASGALNAGEFRPFALKYSRGKIYVGSVTSGQTAASVSAANNSAMNAYIYSFDVASGTFNATPVLTFPLSHNRGTDADGINETWKPWTNAFTPQTIGATGSSNLRGGLPQPMFADIEIDATNGITLGFRDRFGDQSGYQNLNPAGTYYFSGFGYGDIYRGQINCSGTWSIENNATSNGITTAGANNAQGPGGGEYYFQENAQTFQLNQSLGGLAQLMGDVNVLMSTVDPINLWSQGVAKERYTDGTKTSGYEMEVTSQGLVLDGSFGKANGMGDVELMLGAAPMEVGNRIWYDTDGDGIQEAGEPGIAGVAILLYTNGVDGIAGTADDVQVGTTTTNANGEYYFTNAAGTDVVGIDYGVTINTNTNYNIRIGAANWANGATTGLGVLANTSLTVKDKIGTGQIDFSDNDAALNSNSIPMITFTTGSTGQNNHNLDLGFTCAPVDAGPDVTLTCGTTAATIGTPAVSGKTYVWSPALGLSATNIAQPVASPIITTTYKVTVTNTATGCARVDSVIVNVIPNTISLSTTQVNVLCNGAATGSINLTVSGGVAPYTFNWGAGQPTTEDRSGLAVGTYTVIVTDANGCTKTIAATITQPTSLVLTTTQVDVLCNGGSNGSINLSVSGGIAPYTYNWGAGMPTTEDRTGLIAGVYTVIVTDANGCTKTISATITAPTALSLSTTQVDVLCNGASTGSIDLSVSGGVAPYTYDWGVGQPTTQDRTGLAAGTYTVIVTDFNKCSKSISVIIAQSTVVVLSLSQVNVLCNGAATGSIDVTVNGGVAPYTYNWGVGQPTTQDRTGLAAGTYTVIVTDANGCTKTIGTTITEQSLITLSTTQVNVLCNGAATGSIDLTVSGGVAPYTYNWGAGQPTTQDRTGLAVGTYTVIVTDANGCTKTISATLTQPSPLVLSTTQVNVLCNGAATGSIDLSVSGGVAPYTYNWGVGQATTQDRTDLSAGTYTVIVTDANGCTKTISATLTQPTPLVLSTTQLNVLCNGDQTGAINLTVSGGVAPYTFNWGVNQPTTEDLNNLRIGTYTVIVTDANGCTKTVSATITQPAVLALSTTQVNVLCNGAATGSIDLSVIGGVAPYTYNWGAGQPTTQDRTGLAVGTYTVIVTDANGCSNTISATITQPADILLSTTHVNLLCNNVSTGSINLTVTGGVAPYTYNWGVGLPAVRDISNLAAGTYTVIVTDANGCSKSISTTITQPTVLSLSTTQVNVLCNGASTGSIDLTVSGGVAPYTYNWGVGQPSTQDLTGLAIGTYTVIVTDANGCSKTINATITEPTALVLSNTQVNVLCNGAATGSIDLTVTGGVAPYTYNWGAGQPTTQDRSGLAAGTYSVIVTDANGCTKTISATIAQPTPLVLSTSQLNVLCNGDATGSIDLTVSGGVAPYTYNWGAGQPTTQDRTGLAIGTYTVVVTDANGCTKSISATITEPVAIALSATQVNILCNGASTGSIDLSVSGGVAPYTYNWGAGQPTTQDRSGLAAGTYSVVVTDANKCSKSISVTLTEPTALLLTNTQVNVACNGAATGSIDLTVSGGVAPYTYNWGVGQPTTQDRSGLAGGTYTVIVTDANGCSTTKNITITQNSNIILSTTQVNVLCNGASTGSIDLTVSGGVAPYTYNWGVGLPATQDLTGLAAGNYSVTVTDANGCTNSVNVLITQPSIIVLSATQVNVLCNGASTGSIDLTVTGGVAPYTYNWGVGQPTSQDRTGLAAGTYSVIVTDANGCAKTTSIIITQPAILALGTTQVNVLCNGSSTGSIDLTVTGGVAPYTYNWGVGQETTQDRTGLAAGTYTVIVTDANGCTKTISATITQPANIILTTTQVNVSCFEGTNGSIDLTVSGGVAPYSYNWGAGQPTTQDRTGLAIGTYTVIVTDANGCPKTINVTITQPTKIVLSTTQVNVNCFGASTGSIDLTVAGGVAPYTYNWGAGQPTTQDRTGLAAGTYTVIVTDANGCTKTIAATINQSSLIVLTTTQEENYCNGDSTGSIDLTVTGGVAPYTYNWGIGQPTTQDRSDLPAGTYTVIVTDANGCPKTTTVTITEPTPVVITETHENILCNTFSNQDRNSIYTGSIDLTVTGGLAPYRYNWGPDFPTTEDLDNLPAGSYTVIVTDDNDCQHTITIEITQPEPISISSTQVNANCFGANTGSVNITVSGGVAPYTFYWGVGQPTTEDRTGLTAGSYNVLVTDANGCTKPYSIYISQPEMLQIVAIQTNVGCNGLATGSIDLTVFGGVAPYTYNWGAGMPTTQDLTSLATGTYSVIVTDANGCTATKSVTITQNSTIIINSTQVNVLCNGASTGSIDLTISGGVAPYTYNWGVGQPASEDRTGLSAGTYTVIVTDLIGCTKTLSVTITQPSIIALSTTQNNVSCFGGSNGSIDLTVTGGVAPYTYNWGVGQPTTQDLTGLNSGTYSVIVTDANGCIKTISVTITQPTVLALSTTQINVNCFGGATGSIDLTVSGGVAPYTYNWGVGQATTQDRTDLAAGTYSVTVTDANGCTKITSVTITQIPVIALTSTQTNVSCFAGSNGAIDLSVNGGVAPYTYNWGNGQPTSQDRSGLTAGSYTVVVTDANGCSKSLTITITQPLLLELSTTKIDIACNSGTSGSIDLTVIGGVAPYTYNWGLGRPTTQDLSGLAAGTYTVIVTDANGCTATTSVTLITVDGFITGITAPNSNCAMEDVLFLANPPVFGATYAWSFTGPATPSSANTPSVVVQWSAPGVYNATLVVTKGVCSVTYDHPINITQSVFAAAGPDRAICQGSSTTIGGSPTGPGGAQYVWTPNIFLNNGNVANPTSTPPTTITYNVQVTLNGCVRNDEITITVDVALNPKPVAGPAKTICAGQSVTIGGTADPRAVFYQWSTAAGNIPNSNSATINVTPTATTKYYVTAYNSLGCPGYDSVLVTLTSGTIGDYTWIDANGNGYQDNGELPAAGVTVKLYYDRDVNNTPDGAAIATATTDSLGRYLFTNLCPDKYIVGFGTLPGYIHTTQPNTIGEDEEDCDANPTTGYTGTIYLGLGINDLTNDAGYVLPAKIGDFVWNDLNANGIQDAGETGINNVTVNLTLPGGGIVTTTTDNNGYYAFDNLLPGNYSVSFITPSGYSSSLPNQGLNDSLDSDPVGGVVSGIVLTAGQFNNTIDAAFYQSNLLNLGNMVWYDINNNGIKDANEPGIDNATVHLYLDANNDNIADGSVIATTTTNANGIYNFESLSPNNYIVGVVIPNGYAVVPTNGGDPDNDTDKDNNGITTTLGEVYSRAVTLTNAGEPTNDGDGANGNLSVDFGFKGKGSIGDFVWNDANGNGIQDAGEIGIAEVIVTLTYPNGATVSTVTSFNGSYLFPNLQPGTYVVTFTTPNTYVATQPNAGSNDNVDSDPIKGIVAGIVLLPGESNLTVDAGFYQNLTLGNHVWLDLNNNGIKNPGEPGLENAVVNLYEDRNNDNIADSLPIASTTTDFNGLYGFGGLTPGNYIVGVVSPIGYTVVNINGGDPDNNINNDNSGINLLGTGEVRSYAISLSSGNEPVLAVDGDGTNGNLTLDFGFKPVASLGNFVWEDLNKNGLQDNGEPGIKDVIVNLYSDVDNNGNPDGAAIESTNTDANGYYLFTNINPGNYIVGFITPAGFTPTTKLNALAKDTADSDADIITGLTGTVILLSGENDVTNDAGFFRKATLGNYAWYDPNRNGIQDAGEVAASGILVELFDGNNNFVDSARTDANGLYLFDDLNPNNYYIRGTHPNGFYRPTTPNAGTDEEVDSDIDSIPSSRVSAVTNLVSNETDLTWDMGFYRSARFSITDPCGCRNDAYNGRDGRYNEEVTVFATPGGTWRIIQQTGMYLLTSPAPPFAPIPVPLGTQLVETPFGSGNFVYTFEHVDSLGYTVFVTDGFDTLSVSNTCYYPRINVETSNTVACINDPAIPFIAHPNMPGIVKYFLIKNGDTTQITEINPSTIGLGSFTIIAEFKPTDPTLCDNRQVFTQGVTIINCPGSIGNYVWADANTNGIQDGNETGIPNVTVTITLPGGATLSTTTDSTGKYLFTGLLPGTYSVAFTTPAGYIPATSNAGANDSTDSDPINGIVANIVLASGENNTTVDAGYIGTVGSIGDRVWNDKNKNGIQEPEELGIAGVTVTLYDKNGVIIATTLTDAYGKYIFKNLPVDPSVGGSTYQVRFSLLPEYVFSPQNAVGSTINNDSDPNTISGQTGNITLTVANKDRRDVDAGMYYAAPARIGDFIWNDLNKDGIQNSDEPGISGVTVTLYTIAGIPYATTVTDNNGYYHFNDLPSGSYVLGLTPPVGYIVTGKDNGGNDATDSDFDPSTNKTAAFIVNAGTVNLTFDGGLQVTTTGVAAVGDKVWIDLDNDNLQDANEPGVAGVTVQLYTSANVLVAQMVTDAFGNYMFNNLTPGSYYVKFSNIPVDYVYVTANQGGNPNIAIDSDVDGTNGTGTTKTFTLIADESKVTVDAGIRNASITGSNSTLGDFVFYDLNKNGVQDLEDAGVPGVTAILYNAITGATLKTTTTDLTGLYLFTDLPVGSYNVGFVNIPSGYTFTTKDFGSDATDSDVDPNNGKTGTYVIAVPNTNIRTVDAGIITNPNIRDSKGSIGDKVWIDTNPNNIQDVNEPGAQGVTVNLYTAAGVLVATTSTDGLGNYLFTNLDAGNYVVEFTNLPVDYSLITQNSGSNDLLDSDPNILTGKTNVIILAPGEVNLTIDAGIKSTNVFKSSLGDRVWYDINSNGIQDNGEPGTAGVSVTLYDASGAALKNTVTNTNGSYLFTNLDAGTYTIGFNNLPDGFEPTTQNAGGSTTANNSDADAITGLTATIVLGAGISDLTWDMGIKSTSRAGVGNYVWNDTNGNGIQDAGEQGVSGITVTLYDNNGTAVSSSVTNGEGFYMFSNVLPGDYKIGFTDLPVNATFTQLNAVGSTSENNSDVIGTSGLTNTFTLTAGQVRTDIDAGLIVSLAAVGNYVWYDKNENGRQDIGETPVAGVTVILYDEDGKVVASAVTNGNGYYFINNIPVLPLGSNFTIGFTDLPANTTSFTIFNAAGTTAENNSDVDPATSKTDVFVLMPSQIRLDIDAGIITNSPPLPVTGTKLYGIYANNVSNLSWSTLTEINSSHFEVEHSVDGNRFVYVGRVTSAGNSIRRINYNFIHNQPVAGNNYYRLKIYDRDGNFTYSNIVVLNVTVKGITIASVYPNPFVNTINVSIVTDKATTADIRLLNEVGQLMYTQKSKVAVGTNIVPLTNLDRFASGTYIIEVKAGDVVFKQRIIK